MTSLKWFLPIVLLCYCALLGAMYFAQRAIMYFPERLRTAPAAAGLADAEEVVLDTSDGERIIAWHVAPRGDKPVVLYLHGNGGSLAWRANRFRALTADGTGLVALSYRGYGGSSGSPTETGLIDDAAAAYKFAAERYPSGRLAVWGESLGTGVAVALAAEKPIWRLILQSPFTSAADVAAHIYWYLPVRLLMKDQFRSDLLVGKVTAPVLVMHGERDRIVPFTFGQQLYGMVTAPKRFVRFPDGGHNDLDAHGALDAARAFLAEAEK